MTTEKIIEKLEQKFNYKVFKKNIKKDEVEENNSFFVIDPVGEIENGAGYGEYLRRFYVFFVTVENAEIDEFDVIKICRDSGLFFEKTEIDAGKFEHTDSEAKMITFIFKDLICKCECD